MQCEMMAALYNTPYIDRNAFKPYCERLEDALAAKGVRNIAVTGPYGCGKSSFLHTCLDGKNVIWVSLASFAESAKELREDEKLEDKLEGSILQQLLYSARAAQVPFSRFGRIARPGLWRHYLPMSIIFSVVAAVVIGILPISEIVATIASGWMSAGWLLKGALLLVSAFPCAYFAMTFVDFAKNSLLKLKLGTGPVECECGQKAGSILNQNLEEILYFFGSTNYNIVVFEDFDRFERPQLFVKLRELNHLINRSSRFADGRRTIRFVYALRGDVFDSDDNAKFFDFMLPIVPVLNFSTASDRFLERMRKVAFPDGNVDKGCVEVVKAVAHCIPDLRLINNICNEFSVRSKVIPDCVSSKELLGIVVFKTLFPTEFSDLCVGRGFTIRLFTNLKRVLANDLTENFDKKKTEFETKIKQIEEERAKDVKELNRLFFTDGLLQVLPETVENIVILPNGRYTLRTISHPENFEHFVGKAYYCTQSNVYYGGQPPATTWDEFKKFCKKRGLGDYDERRKLIEEREADGIEKLRHQIAENQQKIDEINALSLQELLANVNLEVESLYAKLNVADGVGEIKPDAKSSGAVSLTDGEFLRHEALLQLLSIGALTENYKDYLSAFQEGEFSRADFDFRWSILRCVPLPTNYELANPDKILSTLRPAQLQTMAALNNCLLLFLLKSGNLYSRFLTSLIAFAVESGEKGVVFLYENLMQLKEGNEKSALMTLLFDPSCPFVSKLMSCAAIVRDDRFNYALGQFLLHIADYDDQKVPQILTEYLSGFSKISQLRTVMKMTDDAIGYVLDRTQLKFKQLDFVDANDFGLLDLVRKNHSYEVNLSNIDSSVVCISKVVLSDSEQYLTDLHKYAPVYLIDDLKARHCEMIDNCYLKLSRRQKENWKVLLGYLNNPELTAEEKFKIVDKQSNWIEDLAEICDVEVVEHIMKVEKCKVSFGNARAIVAKVKDEALVRQWLAHAKVELLRLCPANLKEECLELLSKYLPDDAAEGLELTDA